MVLNLWYAFYNWYTKLFLAVRKLCFCSNFVLSAGKIIIRILISKKKTKLNLVSFFNNAVRLRDFDKI